MGTVGVDLIRDRFEPARLAAASPRLKRLLAALDSNRFREREAASAALGEMRPAIDPTLRRLLRSALPPIEVRKRVKALFTGSEGREKTRRRLRAVLALEWMGTREARRLLHALANGIPGAPATLAASAARGRLARLGSLGIVRPTASTSRAAYTFVARCSDSERLNSGSTSRQFLRVYENTERDRRATLTVADPPPRAARPRLPRQDDTPLPGDADTLPPPGRKWHGRRAARSAGGRMPDGATARRRRQKCFGPPVPPVPQPDLALGPRPCSARGVMHDLMPAGNGGTSLLRGGHDGDDAGGARDVTSVGTAEHEFASKR